jgi:heme exporter protein A
MEEGGREMSAAAFSHLPTPFYITTVSASPSSLAAVRLRGIARRFGRRWALRGVSIDVALGEVVAVLGPNGSGKSTLLRVVATVLRPNAGEGWVFGNHLVREGVAVRGIVGFLAHSPGLYEDLSARENLVFAAAMLGTGEEAIPPILERVGLWRERDDRVRGFSAGMQRRLALGRLLLARPRLLLLDEPYNNFDPDGIALVNDVISETRERGGAALVVLHDRRQGGRLLDRTLELARGAVLADDRRQTTDDRTTTTDVAPAVSLARGAR